MLFECVSPFRIGVPKEVKFFGVSFYGGHSSVVEHRTVAPVVVGSSPTARPKNKAFSPSTV